MKIIFDSEKQKEVILKAIAKTEECPEEVGINVPCYGSSCFDCWEQAIECEVKTTAAV